MNELPEKIVRFDTIRVEYGKAKMCQCREPHYEIDYQNSLVYCIDCGAIIDPLEALMNIARNASRLEEYTERLLEQRRQIESYHPRRIVLKAIETQYIRAERNGLEPTCPRCGQPFSLEELQRVPWVSPAFATIREDTKTKGET